MDRAAIQRMTVPDQGSMIVDLVSDAFHSTYYGANVGSLVTITGLNPGTEFIDPGLNSSKPLPRQLGGVQVLFDEVPAEMFQAGRVVGYRTS